jgi:RNA polymerase sigma-70 factor (ECF subfamily)
MADQLTEKEKQAAFTELIAKHQNIIHKICNVYRDTEDDRKDLFQEVVYQIWKSYDSFSGQSKITTWIYRIALNTAIAPFRQGKHKMRKNQVDLEATLHLADESAAPYRNEEAQILYLAISRLNEVEKALTVLYLEEYSYKEIAEVMGISVTNVGVKLNRVKNKLRKIFEELNAEKL